MLALAAHAACRGMSTVCRKPGKIQDCLGGCEKGASWSVLAWHLATREKRFHTFRPAIAPAAAKGLSTDWIVPKQAHAWAHASVGQPKG